MTRGKPGADEQEADAQRNLDSARTHLDRIAREIAGERAPADFLNREIQGEGTRFLTRTEIQVLRDHPGLAWVVNGGPPRPPTEAELARYQGQRGSASYADLMAITARAEAGENEPLLPDSYALADLEAILQEDAGPAVIEGEVIPDEPALAAIQQQAEDTLARWGGKPADLHVVPALAEATAEIEIHHQDTQVIPEVSE